jgi:hypothetical protein
MEEGLVEKPSATGRLLSSRSLSNEETYEALKSITSLLFILVIGIIDRC